MKKALIVFLAFYATTAFAQRWSESGGRFLKRVEYNMITNRGYNFESKTEIEKRLFGDMNAYAEFYVEPSIGGGAYGFRIVMDTVENIYTFETKRITNRREVSAMLEEKYPDISYTLSEFRNITEEEKEMDLRHNNEAYAKRRAEAPGLYNVESRSYPISESLAEAIYDKFKTIIYNYTSVGVPPVTLDGERVKFRTVVADEVWTLDIHSPRGEMRDLADLSRQLMDDLDSGNFDEAKYIELFE